MVHVLLQVLRFKAVKPSEIGIITPYDAQKKRIKNEIINQARVSFPAAFPAYPSQRFPTLFGITPDQGFKVNKSTPLVDIDTVDGFQVAFDEFSLFFF